MDTVEAQHLAKSEVVRVNRQTLAASLHQSLPMDLQRTTACYHCPSSLEMYKS